MDEAIKNIIISGGKAFGVGIGGNEIEKFSVFTEELQKWNKVMNLTAIKEPEDIAVKHYVDSLAILKYVEIEKGAKIADVGCGAGFPGIPVKIIRNDIALFCIDSLNKRLNFINELKERLELDNIECVHLRAEEAGVKGPLRESFDYAFARAVAKLRVLSEYCIPLLKPGGEFIAMKGGDAGEEIEEAKKAVSILGGAIKDVQEYTLPQTDMRRTIIVIKKVKKTQAKYPRTSAKITKSPL